MFEVNNIIFMKHKLIIGTMIITYFLQWVRFYMAYNYSTSVSSYRVILLHTILYEKVFDLFILYFRGNIFNEI